MPSISHDEILKLIEWSLESTPAPRTNEPRVTGNVFDPQCGFSGATVRDAIVKIDDTELIEWQATFYENLCPGISPHVYGIWDAGNDQTGMALERLVDHRAAANGEDMVLVRRALEKYVWPQSTPTPAVISLADLSVFSREVAGRFGLRVSRYVQDDSFCLTHGDPTRSNVFVSEDGLSVKLIDPSPPKAYAPSYRSSDLGKILQSLLGWEQLLTGRRESRLRSPFEEDDEVQLRRTLWWCALHLRRIVLRAGQRRNVAEWCTLRINRIEDMLSW